MRPLLNCFVVIAVSIPMPRVIKLQSYLSSGGNLCNFQNNIFGLSITPNIERIILTSSSRDYIMVIEYRKPRM